MKLRTARMAAVMVVAAATLAGCHTVEGVGEDLTDVSHRTREAITREPSARSTAQGGAESRNRD